MSKWPHDDTASLIAFYGDPRRAGFENNLVLVVPPWPMRYEGMPIRGVRVHRKCAASLKAVFDDIAEQVDHDWSKLPPGAVNFSGSYNYRPVRGSSRLSCHAFGAAIDMDAEHNRMNSRGDQGSMSSIVIDAFKREGWYWGGDFHSRQDPMHFQAAHENSRLAEIANDMVPVSAAHADEAHTHLSDAHGDDLAHEDAKPKATIEELPASTISVRSVGHTIRDVQEAAPAGTLAAIKSLWKSKIAWLSSLGFGTATNATATADRRFGQHIIDLLHNPVFWLFILGMIVLAVLFFRWADHGKGAA